MELFRKRWSVERLFSRAKEWLMLGSLRPHGREQVSIHADLAFTAMLSAALAAVDDGRPWLMRSVKHFTA